MKDLYEQNRFEYYSWMGMKSRCYNPNNQSFKRYGGVGIKVCERWRTNFELFLQDMGPKLQPGFHIHRINSDGDYDPGNCIWIVPAEHAKKKHRPTVKSNLTKRQREILDFIGSCDICPSMRDIATHFNFSPKCAFDFLNALEKKGAITRDRKKARSITIL